ncbi:MAG: hypothetical protein VB064_07670 [Oscillospiraceae bacterium]|nr:hypothetical protein [Oscillospiraceae bacterium]
MKKLKMIIGVLCLTLLYGCSGNGVNQTDTTISTTIKLMQFMPDYNESTTNELPDEQADEITSDDLEEYFSFPQIELLSCLGNEDEIVATDDEIRLGGFYYSKLGMVFVFNSEGLLDDMEAPLGFIICDNHFSINGASREMNFEQIQDKLGEAQIEKTWYESKENIVYEITYVIDGFKYRFFSFDKTGTDSYLTIQKAS